MSEWATYYIIYLYLLIFFFFSFLHLSFNMHHFFVRFLFYFLSLVLSSANQYHNSMLLSVGVPGRQQGSRP